MFDWLTSKVKRQNVPHYSAILESPNRGLPADLAEQEAGQAYRDRHDAIAQWLNELPQRPEADSPLFVEILGSEEGLLTINLPEDNALCLPIFISPFSATDYARTLLDSAKSSKYLSSSPREVLALLRDLRELGVNKFVLNRCPRCNTFCAVSSESMTTVDDLIICWTTTKAIKLARMDLYLAYAQASARAGDLYTAREVLLQTAAHVSFEDPGVHLLLGQLAVALHEWKLLREARAFLQFFKLDSWERRLDEIVQSGSCSFELEDQ